MLYHNTDELLDFFSTSIETPTASAFLQQRSKIKLEALEPILKEFSKRISESFENDTPVLDIDGSKIHIATDASYADSYFMGTNNENPYNLSYLNGLYYLKYYIYYGAIIQKTKFSNEHKALTDILNHSDIPNTFVIADRRYESYNNLAHIQEKDWYYLVRIKDEIRGIQDGLELPTEDSFDINISLKLTRKHTKETKELFKDKKHYRFIPTNVTMDYLPNKKSELAKFYQLDFCIVRF